MPVKNDYKLQCGLIAKATGAQLPMQDVALDLLFIPPRNSGDLDNMLSSVKYGLDAIAEALGTNDRYFRPITIDLAKADKLNPRIVVTIGNKT